MKSILIVISLCTAFLVFCAKPPKTDRSAFMTPTNEKRCVVAENSKDALLGKRSKAAKLPHWHRLIPGMFR